MVPLSNEELSAAITAAFERAGASVTYDNYGRQTEDTKVRALMVAHLADLLAIQRARASFVTQSQLKEKTE